MTHHVTDKTGAYTLTSGTGAYTTEATQPLGFQHLNTIMSTGDTAIVRTEAGADFEVAVLTKTAAHTFARSDVIESTNADAAVSWPVGATMTQALVVPADEFKGYAKEDFLINGNGQVAQRASGTVADDAYGLIDRWYALSQTAATTPSQLTDVEDGMPNMIRLTQPQAAAQRMGKATILEGKRCKKLRGKRVTFGGRLRYSNAAAVRFAILEWTGTEDSVTSDVVNDWTNATFTAGNFFNSTTLTVRAVGSLTPSAATLTDFRISAVLGSAFNNLIVMIWTEGTAAQNSTLDFAAQLKLGWIVQPMAFRSFDDEVFRCRRFYEKSYDITVAPGTVTNAGNARYRANSDTIALQSVPFLASKRTSSGLTITGYSTNSGTSGKAYDQAAAVDRNFVVESSGQNSFCWDAVGVATTPVNMNVQWTAECEL